MKKLLPLLALLLLLIVAAWAENYAVTKDGRTVLLEDDGTWKYTEEDAGVVAEEPKVFWKDIAVNIVKVLAIIVAFITLRLIIQAVGKDAKNKKDPPQSDPPKAEDN